MADSQMKNQMKKLPKHAHGVHLLVDKDSDRDLILENALEKLCAHTSIHHITIQIEGRQLKHHKNNCEL